MNSNNRFELGNEIVLRRRGFDGDVRTWRIKEKVGSGANATCYKAACNGVIGHLKHLKYEERFIEAYERLMEIKNSQKDNEILFNFIPYMELFTGSEVENESEGSLFCWTPEDMTGETLSDYYKKIKSESGTLESKLYKIVGMMITITQGIMNLHKAGLLHLDVKPSNLLVPYALPDEINEHAISMYDIDSFTIIGCATDKISTGTKGYSAPEVERGHADIRSDIYSIGATLFTGIVWDDSRKIYNRDEYDHLDELVKNSPLINESEFQQDDYLIYYLTKILRKCLAFGKNLRYSCCEELLEDLKKAEACMVAVIERKYINPERKLGIENVDSNINPTAVIQNTLFQNPLFKYADKDRNIEVMIIGDGAYARRIIDLCLQSGQMAGYTISVTSISNEPEFACKVYNELRPGMRDFVEMNGEFRRDDQIPYARVFFKGLPEWKRLFGDIRDGDNQNAVKYIAENYFSDRCVSYIFVAAGDDAINKITADNIYNEIIQNANCRFINEGGIEFTPPIYYVNQSGTDDNTTAIQSDVVKAGAVPLQVNDDYETIIDPELERWAFNVHLKWMSNKNADYYVARDLFRQRYNYDASVAYALSIKYKLHSLGISDSLMKNNNQLDETVKNYNYIKNIVAGNLTLVHAEHRRWVLQKLSDGWSGFNTINGETDYSTCVKNGTVKFDEDRKHPCIVFDSPTDYLSKYTKKMWDEPGDYDKDLDELDRVSVNIHRAFGNKTGVIRNQLQRNEYRAFNVLKNYASAIDDVNKKTFDDLCACIKAVISDIDDEKQIKINSEKFDILFRDASANADEPLKSILEVIRKDIYAIQQYVCYIDYKSYDRMLIEEIPFILNNSPVPYEPKPIETDDVILSERMVELVEVLAANSHDIWSLRRINEGWKYGIERDDLKKTNPDIMPFERLPESEKEYDRENARQYIKVLIKMGYLE